MQLLKRYIFVTVDRLTEYAGVDAGEQESVRAGHQLRALASR
jgi:hypothetical protein